MRAYIVLKLVQYIYMHAGLHAYVYVYIPDDHPPTHLLPQWVNPERACQSDWFQLLCAVPDIPHLIVKMPAERERECLCVRESESESESERSCVK